MQKGQQEMKILKKVLDMTEWTAYFHGVDLSVLGERHFFVVR